MGGGLYTKIKKCGPGIGIEPRAKVYWQFVFFLGEKVKCLNVQAPDDHTRGTWKEHRAVRHRHLRLGWNASGAGLGGSPRARWLGGRAAAREFRPHRLSSG